jgi:hypothetical protein
MIASINVNISPHYKPDRCGGKNYQTQNSGHYIDWAIPPPQKFLFQHKMYVIKMCTETRKSWVLAICSTHQTLPPHPKKFQNFYPASWNIKAFSGITALWPSLLKFWLPDTRQPPRHVTGNQKRFDFVFSPWRHGCLWSIFSNRGLSVLSPSLRLYSLKALSIFPQESSRFGQEVRKSYVGDIDV